MTRDEVKALLAVIAKCHPNYKTEDPKGTVEAWYGFTKDYAFEDMMKALKDYETSNDSGFAPSIGQLVGKIHVREEINTMPALEAWALVYKAICNSSYKSEEEFMKLPALCQKAVGRPENLKEWAAMDIQTVNSVSQSQFIKAYNAIVENQKMERRINRPASSNSDRIGMDESQALLN